jgi:hypothetical protein
VFCPEALPSGRPAGRRDADGDVGEDRVVGTALVWAAEVGV